MEDDGYISKVYPQWFLSGNRMRCILSTYCYVHTHHCCASLDEPSDLLGAVMNNEGGSAIASAQKSDLKTKRTAPEIVGPTEDISMVSCTKCETSISSLSSYTDAEMIR